MGDGGMLGLRPGTLASNDRSMVVQPTMCQEAEDCSEDAHGSEYI